MRNNGTFNEPLALLIFLDLPSSFWNHGLDATVATGAAAMMAVRVLLDHDVPEENIMLLSLIMAAQGSTMSSCSVV